MPTWLAISFMMQAPYRWRHALLAPVREHLKQEIGAGNYTPLLSKGLDG